MPTYEDDCERCNVPTCLTVRDPSTCPQPTRPDCTSMCDRGPVPPAPFRRTILPCRHVVQNPMAPSSARTASRSARPPRRRLKAKSAHVPTPSGWGGLNELLAHRATDAARARRGGGRLQHRWRDPDDGDALQMIDEASRPTLAGPRAAPSGDRDLAALARGNPRGMAVWRSTTRCGPASRDVGLRRRSCVAGARDARPSIRRPHCAGVGGYPHAAGPAA